LNFAASMLKAIIQIGLLIFFLAVFFYTRMGMPVQDIFLRSIVLFLVATILITIAALIFFKSVNKISTGTEEEISDNHNRK
jgi:uncharacterized membrane protein